MGVYRIGWGIRGLSVCVDVFRVVLKLKAMKTKTEELELKIKKLQKELQLQKDSFSDKLARLKIEVSKDGFTIWDNDIGKWIIDGSYFLKDGEIRLASNKTFMVKCDSNENVINITNGIHEK